MEQQQKNLEKLLGDKLSMWKETEALINEKYEMETVLITSGRNWDYEYKFRRGGKTLCGLYGKLNCFGFMIIFGKAEREKFEADRNSYSTEIQRLYDEAKTYHDGKWIMILPETEWFEAFLADIEKMLLIKRRPNKKSVDSKNISKQ